MPAKLVPLPDRKSRPGAVRGGEEDRLTLTIPEAAAALGISRNLCYQMAAEGRLPGVLHLGRRVLIGRAALLRALAGETPE